MAKQARDIDDGSEKPRVEELWRRNSPEGELSQEGPVIVSDLTRRPFTLEAWEYLNGKGENESRPPFKFQIRQKRFAFFANDVLKRELTLAEVEVLVNEDVELGCAAPDHQTRMVDGQVVEDSTLPPHKFMGFAAMVTAAREQKDEDGNYWPTVPGLSEEVSRYVVRHPDGRPRYAGSVLTYFRKETVNDRERVVGVEAVPMCGSLYFINKGEGGLPYEQVNNRTHLGRLYNKLLGQQRAYQRSRDRDGKFATVYTYTWAEAQGEIARYEARKAARSNSRDAWDNRWGGGGSDSRHNPGTGRGHKKVVRGSERGEGGFRD